MAESHLSQRVAWAIRNVKQKTGLTWPELARRLGSDKNTLAAYAREKGLIKGLVLERLVLEFGLSAAWLVAGQGEAYAYDESRLETASPAMRTADRPPEVRAGFQRLARSKTELGTDGETPVFEGKSEDPYAFAQAWLAGLEPGPLFLATVTDNAMRPALEPGDTVMIQAGRRALVSGNIYAFTPGDGVMQIRRLESRGLKIGVLADNQDMYAPYELDRGQVRLIGRVVWLARRLP